MTFFYSTSKSQFIGLLATLLLCFFTGFSPLAAQNKLAEEVAELRNQSVDFTPVTLFSSNKSAEDNEGVRRRDADLKEFELLRLQPKATQQFVKERPLAMTITLPDPSGGEMVLELTRFDLLGGDFQVTEMPSGSIIDDLPESVFYRGTLADDANSVVVFSVIGDEVSGLISKSGQSGNFNLVSLKNDDYLLYDDFQVKDKFGEFSCEQVDPKGELAPHPSQEEMAAAGYEKVDGCFGVHLDIANDIHNERGGIPGAISYVQGAFAQVASLYAAEQINITISSITVWSYLEPFYQNLGAYQNFRASNYVNSSLGHYIHGTANGGVAHLRTLCDSQAKYGMSGIASTYEAVPNYSWTVYVIAHELGHNFGSEHTHDCVWNNNYTPIDGCGSADNGCGLSNFLPSEGGTIMSYCHRQDVGINFANGFGQQPGDRIRYYASIADCQNFSGCDNSDQASCMLTFKNTGCSPVNVWTNEGGGTYHITIWPNSVFRPTSTEGTTWQFYYENGELADEFTADCSGDLFYDVYTRGCPCELTFRNTGCSDIKVWTNEGGWVLHSTISPNGTFQPTSEEGITWQFWYNTSEKAGEFIADCSGDLSYDIYTRGCPEEVVTCELAFQNTGCSYVNAYTYDGGWEYHDYITPGSVFQPTSAEGTTWQFRYEDWGLAGEFTVDCSGDLSYDIYTRDCPEEVVTCELTFQNTGCSDINVWTNEGGWVLHTTISPNGTFQITSEEGVTWQFWYNYTEQAGEFIADCSGDLSYDIYTRGCPEEGILPDGLYAIYARHSDLALSVYQGGVANGSNVVQNPFNNSTDQRWYLTHLGDDIYTVANYSSNRMMNVYGNSLYWGGNVIIWDNLNTDNLKWQLQSVGEGYFQLVAQHSGQCLNVSGVSQDPLGNLVQWPCGGGTNDDFYFVPIPESTSAQSTTFSTSISTTAELKLFPNPAGEMVTINFTLTEEQQGGTISLLDLQGRAVKVVPFEGFEGKHELRFNVGGYKSGVYVVNLRTEDLTLNKRLVIR